MKFIIIEKLQLSFPAQVSSTFTSKSEAKDYGYTIPTGKSMKKFNIKNGFVLRERFNNQNTSNPENATINSREVNCGKLTLYLKDIYGYCEIETF